MIDFDSRAFYTFEDLVKIIELLRGPGGCPWDAEQTHESIRRNFLEETYEACEAIDLGDPTLLCEELGDVLTQIVFHASLENEAGRFDIGNVCDGVCKKLIFRHPHVFGSMELKSSGEVLEAWDELKRKEKKQETYTQALDSVARSLPALWRAEKLQKKAAKVGFDWPAIDGAMEKLSEEVDELKQAVACGEGAEDELGDVLFSAVNVARFLGSDPEEALTGTCEKFIARFRFIEEAALKQGREFSSLSLAEMDELWNKSKAEH